MVTTFYYYIVVVGTTSTVFMQFKLNLVGMTTLRCRCVTMRDMFFSKFVRQGIAMVMTFLQKPCGMNFFHSFQGIQIKLVTLNDLDV